MSSSPFATVANAKLIFDVQNGLNGIDEYGNPKSSFRKIELIALLTQITGVKSKKGGFSYATTEQYQLVQEDFIGYLINPLTLPDELRPPIKGWAEITTGFNRVESGEFELLPVTQDPYVLSAGVNIITQIKGIFIRAKR